MPTIFAPSESTFISSRCGVEPIGEPHAKLARPRADAESQHAGDTDDGDQQRDPGKSRKHERIETLGREHFGAHILERGRALDRLIADRPCTTCVIGLHQRIRIARRAHEQPAGNAHLLQRVIHRHHRARATMCSSSTSPTMPTMRRGKGLGPKYGSIHQIL